MLSDRRGFLAFSGSTVATLLLSADGKALQDALRHARIAAGMSPAPPWEFLTDEQAADVEAITSHIIPSDDGPGAREAGVVFFVDRALATWAQPRVPDFVRDLDAINVEAAKRTPGTRFAKLAADQQLRVLRTLEKEPAFRQFRTVTVWAFLSDPSLGGNRDKVGWKHIGFEDRFQWQPPFGDYDR